MDTRERSDHATMVRAVLPKARMWTLSEPEDGSWAIQHSKLITVDDSVSFVTSANFSSAAAHRSLECGVHSSDPNVARALRTHLELLRQNGILVDYDAH